MLFHLILFEYCAFIVLTILSTETEQFYGLTVDFTPPECRHIPTVLEVFKSLFIVD